MQIETGKHYKMRDGRVVGPMLPWNENDLSKGYKVDQILDGYLLLWDTEGKFDGFNNPSDNDEHAHYDLVEVVDETPKTP